MTFFPSTFDRTHSHAAIAWKQHEDEKIDPKAIHAPYSQHRLLPPHDLYLRREENLKYPLARQDIAFI